MCSTARIAITTLLNLFAYCPISNVATLLAAQLKNGLHYRLYVIAPVLPMQVWPCTPTSSGQLSRLVYYPDQFPESRPDLENRLEH
jgi:hypothetical protein